MAVLENLGDFIDSPDAKFEVPRCSHGNLLLGCDEYLCPEQSEYVAEMRRRMAAFETTLYPYHRIVLMDEGVHHDQPR